MDKEIIEPADLIESFTNEDTFVDLLQQAVNY